VAAILDGVPTVLEDEQGRTSLPSVVAYPANDGEPLIGWDALATLGDGDESMFYSVKRLIGRQLEDVLPAVRELLTYPTAATQDGLAALASPNGLLLPEEVSAAILKPLLARAEAAYGQAIEAAVIAVPAHFDSGQRKATKRAGELAGLRHIELLQEPVAAAMAAGIGTDPYEAHTVLVFDLGGGTYDVSILDSFEGIMEVLETGGDALLGGDNWDEALAAWVAGCVPGTVEQPAGGGSTWNLQLRNAVKSAKESLSEDEEAIIPMLEDDAGQAAVLTRVAFEELTAPLVQRLWAPLAESGAAAMLQWADEPGWNTAQPPASPAKLMGSATKGDLVDTVDSKYAPPPRRINRVVLVGAATRMRAVRELVECVTGIKPTYEVDPEHAVALGAAIHAGLLTGQLQSGLELMDGGYVADQHNAVSGFGDTWQP